MSDLIQKRFYDLFSQVMRRPGGYGTLGIVARAMEAITSRNDVDYMRQLFFPDYYPAAPMPGTSMIPTVCFRIINHFSVDPDPSGSFALRFSPEETRNVDPVTGLTSEDEVPEVLGVWRESVPENGWANTPVVFYNFPEKIGDYYDQYRLVGASISLEYTGTVQEHSGYMVAGFFPVYKPEYMNVNSLRKAQYTQEVHPMEGIRCIWFPKDVTDDAFSYPGNRSTPGDVTQAFKLLVGAGRTDETGAYSGTKGQITVADMMASGLVTADSFQRMFNTNQSQVIVIYGTGLPTTAGNKFKAKIVRNFEGIPKPEAAEYVGAVNRKSSPATAEAVAAVAEKIPELLTLPLSVTNEVRTMFEPKYNFLQELIGQVKDYGGVLSVGGASFRRGEGNARDFVEFMSRALE